MTLPTITATGRLGADPELRFTPSGKAVTNFRIACDDRKKDGDEWKTENTVWLAVDQWDDEAESAAHNLKKGDLVTVIGSLNVREYDHNGTKKTAVEIKYGRITTALPRNNKPAGDTSMRLPASNQANPWDQQGGGQAWGTQTTEQPPF